MRKREKQAAITRAVAKYVHLFGLASWEIEVYVQAPNDDSEAKTYGEPEYRRGRLVFTLEDIAEEQIDRYVRHEVSHLVTWPLCHVAYFLAGEDKSQQEMVRLALERVTTDLEIAPFWELLPDATSEGET